MGQFFFTASPPAPFAMSVSVMVKHAAHVISFLFLIAAFELLMYNARLDGVDIDPLVGYGYVGATVLYLLRFASLLALPQCLANMIGLLVWNAFRETVSLATSQLLAPFICIRVVTRGDYPELVRANVERNIETCLRAGLQSFMIEVVTEKSLGLRPLASAKNASRVRETIVPGTYRTKSGALFKARNLQYALEPDVNTLRDDDWVVHLDEETLLTENAVVGILNFVMDGKHHFGQGLVTYANEHIVNWVTTLADCFRVADDMGKLRLQLSYFHRPLFGWKGTFVVAQLGAEKRVTFDHGPDGSIAEDSFFAMVAYRDGFTFNFIEGEMWEKAPFTYWDHLQQRKRWLQGLFLIVHSAAIPLRNKFFLACSVYSWATIPFTTLNVILVSLFPLPCPALFDYTVAFIGAVHLYMYAYGAVRSFTSRCRHRPWLLSVYIIGALATVPFSICIENLAVLLGLFVPRQKKHQFYVVKKEWNSTTKSPQPPPPTVVDVV